MKLKEISYIHAEGYPAGEMKHGPIALIDEQMPVVTIAPHDHVFEKMIGNMQEAKARGGSIIALTTRGNDTLASILDLTRDVARGSRPLSFSSRSSWWCRCSCSRTTSPSAGGATWINRETSPSR